MPLEEKTLVIDGKSLKLTPGTPVAVRSRPASAATSTIALAIPFAAARAVIYL
jgi:hypothetical protein